MIVIPFSDSQMVMKGGLLLCLLVSSVGFFISFFGGVFIGDLIIFIVNCLMFFEQCSFVILIKTFPIIIVTFMIFIHSVGDVGDLLLHFLLCNQATIGQLIIF